LTDYENALVRQRVVVVIKISYSNFHIKRASLSESVIVPYYTDFCFLLFIILPLVFSAFFSFQKEFAIQQEKGTQEKLCVMKIMCEYCECMTVYLVESIAVSYHPRLYYLLRLSL
jgi:hypothetical protein